jgi:predicted nucleic acid-binding protein
MTLSKDIFDTSVLIALMLPHREAHLRCKKVFTQSRAASQAAISTHTIAELYSVLSGRHFIPPKEVKKMLDGNLKGVEQILLEPSDYQSSVERLMNLGIQGGAIFDTLIATCALKVGAKNLYTLNLKHFVRLGEDVAAISLEP